ncbi:MAG: ATP-dependent Clp protease adapter ClpS [Armatimonadetes bacterium]|nr:MAG: ATP-dependent Clp protease adapter ClpS [Armatimonadota bacterium]
MTAPTHSPDIEERTTPDLPWVVIVWDDPVNLMDYVVYVFQDVFGFGVDKATKLMLAVHNEGKAVVFSGMREPAELAVYRLHRYGLWATMEQS